MTEYLPRPEGRLAYDDRGGGPLVVCLPGMGDLRSEYRFLAPRLVEAGFRVVTMDLRGHGESDASFTDHERTSVGDDVVALLEHLGAGPAHVIGTSFGAAAAVWAATEAPGRVASLTLVGPFVRHVPPPRIQRLMMNLLLARPWGVRGWLWWYGKLFPGGVPDDHEQHVAALRRNLAEPGRLEAVAAMGRTDCAAIDPRLDDVTAPVRVVMGTADPDFDDPAAEARAIVARTGGEVVLVDGAGHYPHVEQPEVAGGEIMRFLTSVAREVA